MRLPAATPQQRRTENARAFHERLWTAFIDGSGLVLVPAVEDAHAELVKLSASFHRFWLDRGYRLRLKVSDDKTTIQARIEPRRKAQAA